MKQPSDSPNSRSPLLRLLGSILPAEEPRWLYIVRRGLILLGSLLAAGAVLLLFTGGLSLPGFLLMLLIGALLFDTGIALCRYYAEEDPRPLEVRDPFETDTQFSVFSSGATPGQARVMMAIPEKDVTERKPSEESVALSWIHGWRRWLMELLRWAETAAVTLGTFLAIAALLLWLAKDPTGAAYLTGGCALLLFLLSILARRWRRRKLGIRRRRR